MSARNSKDKRPHSELLLGLLLFGVGAIAIWFNWVVPIGLGWILISVGAYAVSTTVSGQWTTPDTAGNIGVISVLGIVALGVVTYLVDATTTGWIASALWALLITIAMLMLFSAFDLIKTKKLRTLLKALQNLLVGLSLGVLYILQARNYPPVGILIGFVALSSIRQGIAELLRRSKDMSLLPPGVQLLADVLTVILALVIFFVANDQNLLVLSIVMIVIATFRLATESYVPEIADREHAKTDLNDADSKNIRLQFMFGSLTATHASINVLMLLLLLIFCALDFDQSATRLSFQSEVFQVSVGLLAIITGFSGLLISQRLSDGRTATTETVLRGLLGITALFLVIAAVAFTGLSLQNADIAPLIPTASEILSGFLQSSHMRLTMLSWITNSYVFFAVPAALLYFYQIARDLASLARNQPTT